MIRSNFKTKVNKIMQLPYLLCLKSDVFMYNSYTETFLM